jgi:hypothetical protein
MHARTNQCVSQEKLLAAILSTRPKNSLTTSRHHWNKPRPSPPAFPGLSGEQNKKEETAETGEI